jgi:hypothetical protein
MKPLRNLYAIEEKIEKPTNMMGRNIWANPDPVGMTRAIRRIVMQNASVKRGIKRNQ